MKKKHPYEPGTFFKFSKIKRIFKEIGKKLMEI